MVEPSRENAWEPAEEVEKATADAKAEITRLKVKIITVSRGVTKIVKLKR